jgi:tetratricopeptide (TPR) repeat protein
LNPLRRRAIAGPALRNDGRQNPMKLNLLILMFAVMPVGQAADLVGSDFAMGRAHYTNGEFKKAASHFQRALRANPGDADAHYWLGMSYQVLGDIATPFGGSYNSKARVSLTRAMELAPGRPEFRRELFDFLLDSAASSRTALRQAAGILQAVPESDPEYDRMRLRLEDERSVNSSAEARVGRLMLAMPRTAYRIGELPASAWSGLRDAVSPIRTER